MSTFRLVVFTNTDEYVKACTPFDDSFMNFPLGTLLDSTDPHNASLSPKSDHSPRTLLAVYNGDQLIVSLIKISAEFAWMLGTPRGVEGSLSSDEVSEVVSLLAQGIAKATEPKSFDKVIGPQELGNALIEEWVKYCTEQGQAIRALYPFFSSKVSYATRDTLPAPSTAFAHHRIEQATTPEDVEALVPLMVDFTSHGPSAFDENRARDVLHVKVALRQVWVCRVEGKVAGFGAVGRVTPRTIAVRNVYVSPNHRRKGIAEAIVRAITRFYLGAEPLGFEGGPSTGPAEGVKEEVNLNVAEEGAERIYKRCGFLLGEYEPGNSGKRGWFHSVFRGVEYL